MNIGLIDVDGGNFPNLVLMKLSAYHKSKGDNVEWYDHESGKHYDKVYKSKVFTFTEDNYKNVHATEVVKGGSGYCIELVDGIEKYNKNKDNLLPYDIEHIYPDYSLYPESTKNTAYGFLTRGCPRGCKFCHVKDKEGLRAYKTADLNEFWDGQKNILLLDPNLLACKDWKELLQQLIDSKACIDFSQGLDIRLMTDEKAEMLNKLKIKMIHFAWDNYEFKTYEKLKQFRDKLKFSSRKLRVYVLINFNTTHEQDLDRIYKLKELGYDPYVMIYNKESLPRGHRCKKVQRWVNNKFIWWSGKAETFEDYIEYLEKEKQDRRKKTNKERQMDLFSLL